MQELAENIIESKQTVTPEILVQDFLVYLRSCQKNNVSSARDKLTLYC